MISGEVLKYRKGFLIRGSYETPFPRSRNFALTLPLKELGSAAEPCLTAGLFHKCEKELLVPTF
jgi:hypothetical protein